MTLFLAMDEVMDSLGKDDSARQAHRERWGG
jgi:hypothetical protein